MSWEEAWQEGRTGWDAGGSPPALRDVLDRDILPGGRALVPGCGAGYDVLTLADRGYDVTGLDVAPTAAERFRQLAGDRDDVEIVVGDFFEADLGAPFDLIWDYTFLCALQPDQRDDWAARMHDLLGDDGRLVTLIFPISEERSWDDGPPFRMSPDLVEQIVEGRFEAQILEPVTESHPGRAGMEWLGVWSKR